ncbi:MAG: aldehyde dehydrogenase [Cyclobacteriaceae bacterium]
MTTISKSLTTSQENDFITIRKSQEAFFNSGATKDIGFRKNQLKILYKALVIFEKNLLVALHADLHKSPFEAYGTELALVKKEIILSLKKIDRWTKPVKVRSGIAAIPSKEYYYNQPHGQCLIIAPWNYPVQLVLLPLVGAIVAGNCVVLKPSEMAVNTSAVIAELTQTYFDPAYIAVVPGDAEVSKALLKEKWDFIFFTGSTKVGKIVMKAAAEHLTPVVLELGGKSPCIVDKDADLESAARRIVWGKYVNAGQTCIAPDYLLVHSSVKNRLLAEMQKNIETFFGKNPALSPDFGRIINKQHFKRLLDLMQQGSVFYGGNNLPDELYISPTIIDQVKWSDPIMQEEIFGPLLPVITFEDLDVLIQKLTSLPRPLAFYFFSKSKKNQKRIMDQIPFGGGCINDTLLQFGNARLPIGGTGQSGMGQYHGKFSFEAFSYKKSMVIKNAWPDIKLRYPPFEGKLKWLKRAFNLPW